MSLFQSINIRSYYCKFLISARNSFHRKIARGNPRKFQNLVLISRTVLILGNYNQQHANMNIQKIW